MHSYQKGCPIIIIIIIIIIINAANGPSYLRHLLMLCPTPPKEF